MHWSSVTLATQWAFLSSTMTPCPCTGRPPVNTGSQRPAGCLHVCSSAVFMPRCCPVGQTEWRVFTGDCHLFVQHRRDCHCRIWSSWFELSHLNSSSHSADYMVCHGRVELFQLNSSSYSTDYIICHGRVEVCQLNSSSHSADYIICHGRALTSRCI